LVTEICDNCRQLTMNAPRDNTLPAPKRSGTARRLRWILGLGAVLIALAAAYVHFYLYLPMGSGPAGPTVAPAPFESQWTERRVLLVGIGDSVTAGFGASPGKSYFDRLIKNPPDEFADLQDVALSRVIPNLQTLNISVSGSNSLQHLDHIRDRLSVQTDDVFGLVVMTTGGNDLIHWYGQRPPKEGAMYGATLAQARPWIDNYGQRLDSMFESIERCFPGGCLIFVADIYDPSDGAGDPEAVWLPAWPDCLPILEAYNAKLREIAAKHPSVRVVPVHNAFLGHGIHCRKFWRPHFRSEDPCYWYLDNIEDPNDRGYDALRRIFLNSIVAEHESIAR
jgi:lysophospholipase L1-like esterase